MADLEEVVVMVFRARYGVMVVLGLVMVARGEGSATQVAATEPVMAGRDTPEGAMNVFEKALESGDVAMVGDSWNLPAGRREGMGASLVVEYRFREALGKRFSAEEVVRVCSECRIWVKPAGRAYVAGDWLRPLDTPDVALPRNDVKDVQAVVMQRGEDGIWRMGRIAKAAEMPPPTAEMKARMADLEERQALEQAETVRRYGGVLENLEAGKYGTGEEVIHALYPEGSPEERARKEQAGQGGTEGKP